MSQSTPDSLAIIEQRLKEWTSCWNDNDFTGLENFYVDDSFFLPPGRALRRGKSGYAEFISEFIADNNWGKANWSLVTATSVGDDLIASVDVFEIESTSGGPPTLGKEVIVWRKVNGVFLIQYECLSPSS